MQRKPPDIVTRAALDDRSTDIMLSLGGVTGHLALDPAPGPFLRQLRERYQAFTVPAAPWVKRAFSLKVSFHSAVYHRPKPISWDRPIDIRETDHALDVSRWDFRAHLEPRQAGVVGPWAGTASCELNPLAFDSMLRILWSVFLPRTGGALLHACGLRSDEVGFVFPGVSGAGKSTLAAKMPDHDHVLSDEIVAVGMDELGRWRISGTPFWGDFKRGGGSIRSWPLHALSFLQQSDQLALTPIAPGQAARRLLECFLCFQHNDVAIAERNMAVAVNLCQQVPGFVSQVRKDTAPADIFGVLRAKLAKNFSEKDTPPTVREVISEFRWSLNKHGKYAYKPRGTSMRPWLKTGDSLFIETVFEDELVPGDILLYWSPGETPDGDQLTCHRMIAKTDSGKSTGVHVYAKGDAVSSVQRFENGRQAEILGKVVGVSRDGKDLGVPGRLGNLARLLGSLVATPVLRMRGR